MPAKAALVSCFVATFLVAEPSVLAFQPSETDALRKPRSVRLAPLHNVKVKEQEDCLTTNSVIERINIFDKPLLLPWQQTSQKAASPTRPLMNVESDMASVEIDQTEKVAMLSLLWVTACLSALDRVAMSVALVPMTVEFGLTDTVKGSISSFFSVGYGLGIIPAGILLSFASPRIVMSTAVVSWSLATLATPWAAESLAVTTTAGTLLFIRACVGAAESLVMPTLQRLLLAWTTAEEKAVGIATVVSGFQAGTIAAYLVSPIVMDAFGNGDAWRQLFYVYGAFGLALLVPWLLVAKDGPTSVDEMSFVNAKESSLPEPPVNFQSAMQYFKDAPWSDFVRSKGAWAMLLAHCSKNW